MVRGNKLFGTVHLQLPFVLSLLNSEFPSPFLLKQCHHSFCLQKTEDTRSFMKGPENCERYYSFFCTTQAETPNYGHKKPRAQLRPITDTKCFGLLGEIQP